MYYWEKSVDRWLCGSEFLLYYTVTVIRVFPPITAVTGIQQSWNMSLDVGG